MTNNQWDNLLSLVSGETPKTPFTGFIIDSPWIPGWAGISTLNYYASDKVWFNANKKAIETFPDIAFLPGFWSEYGMLTEPSAFGAKMVWTELNLPHADKVISSVSEVGQLSLPNPRTDGLLPFMIQRLVNHREPMLELGHKTKFAVARGPLNIASFLMGTTELMMGMMMDPENTHKLLELITQFSIDWIQRQKEVCPEIEAILLLDDIVGFVGDQECKDFAVPYIKRIFKAIDSKVNFFHNDAKGLVCSPYLKEMGVNLFNFSFEHSMKEIRELAGPEVALIGNLPPRDVLAAGTPEIIREHTKKMVQEFGDKNRVIWSCGGGMPQNVSTENIRAFKDTIDKEVQKL